MPFSLHLLPAAQTALTVTEWDTPATSAGWGALLVGGAALVAYILWLGRRDTRQFAWYITTFLLALRLGVVAALAVVLLNPQERTQTIVNRPSRLALLVDTSLSMRDPERTPTKQTGSADAPRSRAAVVTELLERSPLVAELAKVHELHVFTFDTGLKPQTVVRGDQRREAASDVASGGRKPSEASENSKPSASEPPPDWPALLEPVGAETRLGEVLAEAVRLMKGPTLAGLVVMTDGGLNAGTGEDAALALARDARNPVRIATVGVGGLERPANVVVAEVRAPGEVRYNRDLPKQDPFEVIAFVRGDELPKQTVTLDLLRYPADQPAESAALLNSTTVTLPDDGRPVEVRFPQEPDAAGQFRYIVRAKPPEGLAEYRSDDNAREVSVNFSERNTAVLIIAGGPMRDYHFVRNMLHRGATTDVDVWLQTVSAEDITSVSQESDDLLTEFPPQFPRRPLAERLPEGSKKPQSYDVVIAFDANWNTVPTAGRDALTKWIAKQRGGLIVVAGDVYTPLLADASGTLGSILDLYPVILSNRFLLEMTEADASQPWAVGLTPSGKSAGFLQLAGDADEAESVWKDFPGVYRAFPTRQAKDLAEVYATFSDPRAATDGPPVLIASQQVGGGRVMYLGSPETWRLRALGENYFNTLWTKMIREVGQGRLRQGDGPGLFLLDRDSYLLGETVRVRAQLNTPQGDPLNVQGVKLYVVGPGGRDLFPAGREVEPDAAQPGQYLAAFRAAVPGRYTVRLAIPGSETPLTTTVEVTLPQLEQLNPRQDKALLVKLAEETRGEYFTIEQAAVGLPKLFSTSLAESVPIDERLRTLWDRQWLMFLVVGLLCVEWLTRKLLKLA